jgi:hypothetical protein
MLIELITPLVLATAPMTITVTEPLKYSHEKQQVQAEGYQVAQRMPTMNGTQTFDWNGRPNDSDTD